MRECERGEYTCERTRERERRKCERNNIEEKVREMRVR